MLASRWARRSHSSQIKVTFAGATLFGRTALHQVGVWVANRGVDRLDSPVQASMGLFRGACKLPGRICRCSGHLELPGGAGSARFFLCRYARIWSSDAGSSKRPSMYMVVRSLESGLRMRSGGLGQSNFRSRCRGLSPGTVADDLECASESASQSTGTWRRPRAPTKYDATRVCMPGVQFHGTDTTSWTCNTLFCLSFFSAVSVSFSCVS